MIPKVAVVGVGIVLMGLVVLVSVDSCRKKTGQGSEVIAAEAKGEANAHQAQAQASDKALSDLQAKHLATKATLDRLSAERVALLRRLEAERQARLDAESAHPAPVEPVPDVRDAVIVKDAEVIAAQAVVIGQKDAEIVQLTTSRDQWKATAEARERQALAQEAATRAWKSAVTESRWLGRGEGFLAGVALGYVARGQR